MALVADGWETHSLYAPASTFQDAGGGIYEATVYAEECADQPAEVWGPPGGWRPTHLVALLCDVADMDWIEVWSGDPNKGGRLLGGRLPVEASDISVPLLGLTNPLTVRVSCDAAPTLTLLLARRTPPCSS